MLLVAGTRFGPGSARSDIKRFSVLTAYSILKGTVGRAPKGLPRPCKTAKKPINERIRRLLAEMAAFPGPKRAVEFFLLAVEPGPNLAGPYSQRESVAPADSIPYFKPRRLPFEEVAPRLRTALESGWHTNFGPCEAELSEALADLHGVDHCVLVANGTLGLMVALKAHGVTGDVLVPGFTFIATAHAAAWQGLRPVLCDIHPNTLTIAPSAIEQAVTASTTAVLGVHVFGQSCDVQAISRVAERHGLVTIYDAAHCFGVQAHSIPGGAAATQVLSLHATKVFSTIEGGAILTNDAQLAESARAMTSFGLTDKDQVSSLGINAKLSEVHAAYGLALLPHVPETVARLAAIGRIYRSLLSDEPGVTFVDGSEQAHWQFVVARIDEQAFGMSRDALRQKLATRGIETKRYFAPGIQRCEPYASDPFYAEARLPVTDAVCHETLCLPNFFDLKDSDIFRVCAEIQQMGAEARASFRQARPCASRTVPF